ncbi:1-acyl-sn-glycerol-3-phosphate acyltransferase [Corallococcus interemptor]|uniref:lysophospholipid acyltransferase family protein n=1 Tax=Corallococcus TaxID=83461 RepID=UPI001CBFDFBF|nr:MULTISPECIES: lysophospholipid acyltransferase family protein [unclassified Corallococcus]MBZ4333085.1 1-acyl-sn-glycerol-3-phosphate acyltransferase [Corallococcus sp. AS-1-12]MBZ4373895.1 1-acyl-sn-glycerol-3-phosphate acyltransferase [Corallococcus sp. AS-1-6]
MLEKLDRPWRIFATGLSFATFGLGGLALRLLYFPLLALFVRDPARQQRLARLAVHYTFRFFIGYMRALGVLRYELQGVEKLARSGLLILANHPSLIDVVFLISLVPNADCVVKASLANNPFTRGPIRATRYLCNDSGPGLIQDCIASVKAGNNLIIFPEGSRTPLDGNMQLQRGAANIAVRGPCDITPVIIRCEPRGLTKGMPWWKVPSKPMHYVIRVEDDIPVSAQDAEAGEAAKAARQLTTRLHDHFSRGSQGHVGA